MGACIAYPTHSIYTPSSSSSQPIGREHFSSCVFRVFRLIHHFRYRPPKRLPPPRALLNPSPCVAAPINITLREREKERKKGKSEYCNLRNRERSATRKDIEFQMQHSSKSSVGQLQPLYILIIQSVGLYSLLMVRSLTTTTTTTTRFSLSSSLLLLLFRLFVVLRVFLFLQ